MSRAFNKIAESYDKYRPRYPEEMYDFLKDKFELNETSYILDIACGTGIVTRELARISPHTYGVDRAAGMLKIAEETVKKAGLKVIFRDGAAEDTGLPDNTFDLITVGQAFHWFDLEPTFTEFDRLLKPNGSLAVFWNNIKTINESYYQKVLGLVKKFNPNFKPNYRYSWDTQGKPAPDTENNLRESEIFKEIEVHSFPNLIEYDFDKYVGFFYSKSYVGGTLSSKEFEKFVEEMKMVLSEYFPSGRFVEEYNTDLFLGIK